MLHFGSSKHSSNLLGFGLSSKKKSKSLGNHWLLAFFQDAFFSGILLPLHSLTFGRGAKKNNNKTTTNKHLLAYLISDFQLGFSRLLEFFQLITPLSGHGYGDPADAGALHSVGVDADLDIPYS